MDALRTAFLDDYGTPESDPGDWEEIGKTDGVPVRLRIRPVPSDVTKANLRKHTKNEIVTNPVDGFRGAQAVPKDWEDNIEFRIVQATFAVTDSENLTLVARDEASAKFFSRALGRVGSVAINVDDTVVLDGHLTDLVKDYIFRHHPKMMETVISLSVDVAKRRTAHIKVLEGNS